MSSKYGKKKTYTDTCETQSIINLSKFCIKNIYLLFVQMWKKCSVVPPNKLTCTAMEARTSTGRSSMFEV